MFVWAEPWVTFRASPVYVCQLVTQFILLHLYQLVFLSLLAIAIVSGKQFLCVALYYFAGVYMHVPKAHIGYLFFFVGNVK